MEDHYPGYEKVDATHGKIGDIDVEWKITENANNAYQNDLDAKLLANESASEEDKIDMFLLEADYALKYVDADVTLPVEEVGISESELSNQYQYTKDIVTSQDGKLKAVSWQATPCALIYNREIAKELWGSDDPDTVAAKVDSWDNYYATAKEVADKGYYMQASVNDTYRVYSNNAATKWVDGTNVQIDPGIKEWVAKSKELVDMGACGTFGLWTDEWNQGFMPDGINGKKVFCYLGPAWLINFCMKYDTTDSDVSIADNGGWAACQPPQDFYWGGTWMAAAKGTDNPALVGEIMRTMTTDETVMLDITKKDKDYINNEAAMNGATGEEFNFEPLGGQNPIPMLSEKAKAIVINQSPYDQGCNEEFQNAMKNYFDGKASEDEAIAEFYKNIKVKYPELTTPE